MKKVIGIAAVLLLASAVMASATATNWLLSVKATDVSNMNYNPTLTIGTMTGYTDGLDTAKGEPGSIPATPLGKTLATASTLILGASKQGVLDVKAPIVGPLGEKEWRVNIYTMDNGGPGMGTIKVLITPSTTMAPVYMIGGQAYEYDFIGTMVPGGLVKYYVGGPMGTMPTSFSFLVTPTHEVGKADVLTVLARPVPEPGGMLALGSGLVGLIGLAIRRRR